MVWTLITGVPHSPEQAVWRKRERWQFWRPECNPGSAPKQPGHLARAVAQRWPQFLVCQPGAEILPLQEVCRDRGVAKAGPAPQRPCFEAQ